MAHEGVVNVSPFLIEQDFQNDNEEERKSANSHQNSSNHSDSYSESISDNGGEDSQSSENQNSYDSAGHRIIIREMVD